MINLNKTLSFYGYNALKFMFRFFVIIKRKGVFMAGELDKKIKHFLESNKLKKLKEYLATKPEHAYLFDPAVEQGEMLVASASLNETGEDFSLLPTDSPVLREKYLLLTRDAPECRRFLLEQYILIALRDDDLAYLNSLLDWGSFKKDVLSWVDQNNQDTFLHRAAQSAKGWNCWRALKHQQFNSEIHAALNNERRTHADEILLREPLDSQALKSVFRVSEKICPVSEEALLAIIPEALKSLDLLTIILYGLAKRLRGNPQDKQVDIQIFVKCLEAVKTKFKELFKPTLQGHGLFEAIAEINSPEVWAKASEIYGSFPEGFFPDKYFEYVLAHTFEGLGKSTLNGDDFVPRYLSFYMLSNGSPPSMDNFGVRFVKSKTPLCDDDFQLCRVYFSSVALNVQAAINQAVNTKPQIVWPDSPLSLNLTEKEQEQVGEPWISLPVSLAQCPVLLDQLYHAVYSDSVADQFGEKCLFDLLSNFLQEETASSAESSLSSPRSDVAAASPPGAISSDPVYQKFFLLYLKLTAKSEQHSKNLFSLLENISAERLKSLLSECDDEQRSLIYNACQDNITFLGTLVRNNDHERLALILELVSNVDEIHTAFNPEDFHQAINNNGTEVFGLLFEKDKLGTLFQPDYDGDGVLSMELAARKGNVEALKCFMAAWKEDEFQPNHVRVLREAVRAGQHDLVRKLLRSDPETKTKLLCADAEGLTPLHWAAIMGDLELCALLSQQNGLGDVADRSDKNYLDYLIAFFSLASLQEHLEHISSGLSCSRKVGSVYKGLASDTQGISGLQYLANFDAFNRKFPVNLQAYTSGQELLQSRIVFEVSRRVHIEKIPFYFGHPGCGPAIGSGESPESLSWKGAFLKGDVAKLKEVLASFKKPIPDFEIVRFLTCVAARVGEAHHCLIHKLLDHALPQEQERLEVLEGHIKTCNESLKTLNAPVYHSAVVEIKSLLESFQAAKGLVETGLRLQDLEKKSEPILSWSSGFEKDYRFYRGVDFSIEINKNQARKDLLAWLEKIVQAQDGRRLRYALRELEAYKKDACLVLRDLIESEIVSGLPYFKKYIALFYVGLLFASAREEFSCARGLNKYQQDSLNRLFSIDFPAEPGAEELSDAANNDFEKSSFLAELDNVLNNPGNVFSDSKSNHESFRKNNPSLIRVLNEIHQMIAVVRSSHAPDDFDETCYGSDEEIDGANPRFERVCDVSGLGERSLKHLAARFFNGPRAGGVQGTTRVSQEDRLAL